MKNYLLRASILVLCLAHSAVFAQKKELLLTIPETEEFDFDNSRIVPTDLGASWEIVTQASGNYFLYTKTEKRKQIGVDIREGEFITFGREGGLDYFRVNPTGKKYGPIESLAARYNEEKGVLYGYSYKKEGKIFIEDLRENKVYGPFAGGGIWYMDENNLVYSYSEKNASTQKDDYYLMINGTKKGPYEQVSYRHPEWSSNPGFVIYKKEGRFYLDLPQCKDISFTYQPTATELKSGWLIEGMTGTSFKEKWIYMPNGTKLENSEKVRHTVNVNGEVLKAELIAGGGSDAAFKVTYKGNEIGTYALKKNPRSDIYKSDFFDWILVKVQITNNHSLAFRNENFLFSQNQGMIGPFTENESRYTFFVRDGYAVIKADSSLVINGIKKQDHVTWAELGNYPESWLTFQQRGDYVYPFKNGMEIKASEIPGRLRYMCTAEQDVVKVQRKDNFYLRYKKSEKLLGPVGQYDPFVVSADGKHWATLRGQDEFVVVNGKPIAKGTKIFYNEKNKTFYWISLEGQKVFMVSYKPAP